jgi:protein TonB
MPLKVRRIYTSVLLVVFGFITFSHAQQQATPTSGDVMRERISKAKAYIAVRNYSAAIYELENIRRESNDSSLQGGVYVLLMNSYLEQGDYKRAQDLLNNFFNTQKTSKPNASTFYRAVAGQIVKSARDRVERYRALGLNVSDRTLPLEATNDLEKMRETLELVITQNKEIGQDKAKTADAMALVEEASNSRTMLARDDYDARRWRDEVADTREAMANSRSVVMDVSGEPSTTTAPAPAPADYVAVVRKEERQLMAPPGTNNPLQQPSEVKQTNTQPADASAAQSTKPEYVPAPQQAAPISQPAVVKEEPKPNVAEQPKVQPEERRPNVAEQPNTKPDERRPNVAEQPKENKPLTPNVRTGEANSAATAPAGSGPIDVGSSLLAYATKQATPVVSQMAKSMGAKGVVRVDVTVDEQGDVTEVKKTSGPSMLQAAAKDAIRKWKFKPFVRDGQPVKATGFVNFNFNL